MEIVFFCKLSPENKFPGSIFSPLFLSDTFDLEKLDPDFKIAENSKIRIFWHWIFLVKKWYKKILWPAGAKN